MPAMTETYRVIKGYRYFKSADVGQILKVYEKEEDIEKDLEFDHKTFKLENGLTPSTKNIEKRYYKKRGKRSVFIFRFHFYFIFIFICLLFFLTSFIIFFQFNISTF